MGKEVKKNQNDSNDEIKKGKDIELNEHKQFYREVLNYQPTKDELEIPPSSPSGVPNVPEKED